jgi:K+-transporting ATPase c subunit
MFTRYLRPGLSLVFALTLIVGVIYPFVLAGVSRLAFV